MKLPYSLLLAGMLAVSCTNTTKSTTETSVVSPDSTPAIPGGDADQHGCKGSAGYAWSVVKNECIRVWETGIQLVPTTKQESYTANASVVLSTDQTQAELFVVPEKGGVLLTKQADMYTGNGYELRQVKQKWQLLKDRLSIYSEK